MNLFTCEHCGETFIGSAPDATADEECLQLFGVDNAAQRFADGDPGLAVICDVCFQKFMRFYAE